MVIIFHPWAVNHRENNQSACWQALAELRQSYSIFDVACTQQNEYEHALQSIWDTGNTIIICEHDIVPTTNMIEALIECSHPCCAQAYTLYPATTALDTPVWAHRVDVRGSLRWIDEGEEWADRAAFGLTKISASVQRQTPPQYWRKGRWLDVDTRVSEAIAHEGNRFHVHWPEVPHHHR